MRRLALIVGAALLTPQIAAAEDSFPTFDVHGLLDVRLFSSDDQLGWLDGGQGKTRFGGQRTGKSRTGAAIGEASLILQSRFSWDVDGFLHLKHEREQGSPIDAVEAFVRYKPVSTSAWRFGLKVGAFFPPVSLENTDIAWQSPYTISWSAINSWIGEDIRTTGTELSSRYRFDGGGVTLGGALFVGNDPSGTILSKRGWALHDSATGLFDNIPQPAQNANLQATRTIKPFKEVDDTPGFYLFVQADDEDIGGQVLFTLYDNLADDGAVRGGQDAWRTRFAAAGITYDLPFGIELLSQIMYGDTKRVPTNLPSEQIDVRYGAAYLMFSGHLDDDEVHRLSLRHDRFKVDDRNPLEAGPLDYTEFGDAWTLAYSFRPDEHHWLSFELLSVDSKREARSGTGDPLSKRDTTLQASYRFTF